MGIFSAIFGHTKLKTPDREQFFTIIGAAYDLEARTELRPTYKAGVVVNPVESSYFDNLDSEMAHPARRERPRHRPPVLS